MLGNIVMDQRGSRVPNSVSVANSNLPISAGAPTVLTSVFPAVKQDGPFAKFVDRRDKRTGNHTGWNWVPSPSQPTLTTVTPLLLLVYVCGVRSAKYAIYMQVTIAITRSRRAIVHCQNARLRDSGALRGYLVRSMPETKAIVASVKLLCCHASKWFSPSRMQCCEFRNFSCNSSVDAYSASLVPTTMSVRT